MTKYDQQTIELDDITVDGIGFWDEHDDYVEFKIFIYKSDNISTIGVPYKSWSRKKLGNFDPMTMITTPDIKITKILDKFSKMGKERFLNRFNSLMFQSQK